MMNVPTKLSLMRKRKLIYDLKPCLVVLLVSKAGPAHFTKFISTVTVGQATSQSHARVTPSQSDPGSSLLFGHCSCEFPLPIWLRQVSIINPEWWGVCVGITFPQPWMGNTTPSTAPSPAPPCWWRWLELRSARIEMIQLRGTQGLHATPLLNSFLRKQNN